MLALKSMPIYRSHDADLKTMLKYVMMKIGIRANNLPDDIETQVLLNHIKSSYGNNSIDEIRLAFDMAVNEELNINPDDIKHYENFSCAYFSRIMNAYVSWAAQEYKFLKHEPPPQKIYTEEENDNFYRMWTEEFYQQLRNGIVKEPPAYIETILKKDKLLAENGSVINFFVYRLGKQIPNIYVKE